MTQGYSWTIKCSKVNKMHQSLIPSRVARKILNKYLARTLLNQLLYGTIKKTSSRVTSFKRNLRNS